MRSFRCCVTLGALLAAATAEAAITFTNDTLISFSNTNFDGEEIVVANCTLTVDGAHSFTGLRLLQGGVLTHSFAPNGLVQDRLSIAAERHILSDTNPPALSLTNVLASTVVVRDPSASLTYIPGTDYTLFTTNGLTYILRTAASAIADGAEVEASYKASGSWQAAGLDLAVTGDVDVESGGAINVAGRGFAGRFGVGSGSSAVTNWPYSFGAGSGGGHGGAGGASSTLAPGGACHGLATEPQELGGGGGSYPGAPWTEGGAGGGIIKLAVGGQVRVEGRITAGGADGVSPHSGGGAGGSVWITATALTGAGSISANGGAGEPYDGGGGGGGRIAIYCGSNSFAGTMSARGGTGAVVGGAGTIYRQGDSNTVAQLIIDNAGQSGTNTLLAPVHGAALTISGGAILCSVNSSTPLASLTIGSNSWFTLPAPAPMALALTVAGDATIGPNGGISVDQRGHLGGQGPGAGPYTYGGAGHGGLGGASSIGVYGGPGYGSLQQPGSELGSGGGSSATNGGRGGGAISLVVGGMLTLNGSITANGGAGIGSGGGGGSGGGILLQAGKLTGAGTACANGGAGDRPKGGGGGGGRVAAYCDTNEFTGSLMARGGPGAAYGGAGTVYFKVGSSPTAQVILDNGGQRGTNTFLPALPAECDLTVRGEAVIEPANVGTVHNLVVGPGGWLIPGWSSVSNVITITGDATIASGGGILLDGQGYLQNNRPGAWGGALRIMVAGTLRVDGRLTADGAPGSGGGSGGSLWLSAERLAGTGVISANGGYGVPSTGAGGRGGSITLYCATNEFAGTLSAHGGDGAPVGGAGPIYFYSSLQVTNASTVLLDNAGLKGTNTVLPSMTCGNMTINNGASVGTTGPLYCANLVINSNSWLVSASDTLNLYTSNLTVQAGGGIDLSGLIHYGDGQYRGAYDNASRTGGGGGNGGCGGSSAFGARGGYADGGSLRSPWYGSSGGGNDYYSVSGSGGGYVQIAVSNALVLDGIISANGTTGIGPGTGGGSGGGVLVNVGNFLGGGRISVDGGSGSLPYGGGGGGGRIAIFYGTNRFTGVLSARGGLGASYGGAGTVYMKANDGTATRVTVDNGGWRGSNTVLPWVDYDCDLTISGGAVVGSRYPTGLGLNVQTLFVGSNAWLSASFVNLTGDAIIEPGGEINLDGCGSQGYDGKGGTNVNSAGGGGYGGCGGAGGINALGGQAFGSVVQPDKAGGPGGFVTSSSGSLGGGAIKIITPGLLLLEGRLSANGAAAASLGGGGGAGGSIWIAVGKLAGSGFMSANGGPGDLPLGGGGGGGRIAVYCATNEFTGGFSAHGGLPGAQTPIPVLPSLPPLDLAVSGGACAYPSNSTLYLSRLLVDTGATLTGRSAPGNQVPCLGLMVYGDALIGTNAAIAVDGQGGHGANGEPGAGQMGTNINSSGSGGGYGGAGGASRSGEPGGAAYGSPEQPTSYGSRGGLYPVLSNFCEGGGALRLQVTGTLALHGRLSANGNSALIEAAGGGAGGSIWLTARRLEGAGAILACGGAGNPDEGGGGGGGRIALYCGRNLFSGQVLARGGPGANPGQDGTVVTTNLPVLRVIFQTPHDVVSSVVTNVSLLFSSPLDFASVSTADLVVLTPGGRLSAENLSLSRQGDAQLDIRLPAQASLGYYEIQLGAGVSDMFGTSLSAPYTGDFILWPPTVSGRVTDTDGHPVPYVTLNPGAGLLAAVTDTNGFYTLEVAPSWAGTITPSRSGAIFLPACRTYTDITANLFNQDFLMADPSSLTMSIERQAAGIHFNWHGIQGVSYQLLYSTNLVDWTPYGLPLVGAGKAIDYTYPFWSGPARYFRLKVSH